MYGDVEKAGERAAEILAAPVEVEVPTDFPHPGKLPLQVPRWSRVSDVSVVLVDLVGSTRMSHTHQANTTAKVYEAATGLGVSLLNAGGPSFVDVQGDGMFALYHGPRSAERAFVAAVDVYSFGVQHLEKLIRSELGGDYSGHAFRVGVDRGTLLAKRVGVRGPHNAPVWAGKPVNYAAKVAQALDGSGLGLTQRMFAQIADSEYATISCGCVGEGVPGGEHTPLWKPLTVDTLPDPHNQCLRLPAGTIGWCPTHGGETSTAIMRGVKTRNL